MLFVVRTALHVAPIAAIPAADTAAVVAFCRLYAQLHVFNFRCFVVPQINTPLVRQIYCVIAGSGNVMVGAEQISTINIDPPNSKRDFIFTRFFEGHISLEFSLCSKITSHRRCEHGCPWDVCVCVFVCDYESICLFLNFDFFFN